MLKHRKKSKEALLDIIGELQNANKQLKMLEDVRSQLGITLDKVIKNLGTDKSTYEQWLNGEAVPDNHQKRRILEVLHNFQSRKQSKVNFFT